MMKHLNEIKSRLTRLATPLTYGAVSSSMLLLLFAACSEQEDDPRAALTQPLTLYLQAAGSQQTRAYEGEVQGKEAEKTLNDVKVWLFDRTVPGMLLDYKETTTSSVVMDVPQYIIDQNRTVDLYAIGNASVVGLTTLNGTTPLEDLKAAVLQGTNFTPTGNTRLGGTDGVSALPFSRVLQQLPVVVEKNGKRQLSENLGVINLTRAVSKVRFAFARTTGLDDVDITGIEFDGNLFPSAQCIFPIDSLTSVSDNEGRDYAATGIGDARYIGDLRPNLATTNTFITDKLVLRAGGDTDFSTALVANADIREYDDPSANTWAAMKTADASLTAQMYDDFINTVIQGKYDFTTYLRETSKPITGTIHYTMSGVKRQKTFSMSADQVNDFARNHEWIVYGYFKGEELQLTFTVMPWIKWLRQTDYKSNVSVSQQLHWIDGTYDNTNTNAAAPITIDGTAHKVMVLTYGTSIEGSFSFDTPYGGTWMAILEPINGSENGSIVFTSNNETTLTGTIGTNAVTFQIKAAENQVSRNQYARLRFVCYSMDHQPYPVNDGVIGGPYVIAQYAN